MKRFLLTDIRFERGRSGRLLNVFCFLGLNGPFEVILADENLPLTEEKFAACINDIHDAQDSPLLAVMEHYGVEKTRDEYIKLNYIGEVDPDEEIPADVEETFPKQFRRKTLIETPPISERVQ